MNKNMEDELKPCPFCGGAAQLIENCMQDPLGRPRVDCSVCRGGFDYCDKEVLVKRWNTRISTERAAPCQHYCEQAAFNAEIKKLKALIKEAADYLDTGSHTSIASNSIMHREFREAV
ncbi:Lar family restriction alleviation protein [Sansalvadorimonas verongulae]|uniref:Lar family restriction alleviation protein n=1 Tax=Sansalvadorimonas verongulae TaxID=2172824 RepID=UPI0012BCF5F1|nr:Lar family restriction alleviation protein [Sansalvadorimonas verongulae]MTI12828.1 hypothetical protein [Sansalvadorimonas verongulae]